MRDLRATYPRRQTICLQVMMNWGIMTVRKRRRNRELTLTDSVRRNSKILGLETPRPKSSPFTRARILFTKPTERRAPV
jgi:hypothetical protein